jgi:hypothetical protein
MSDQINFAPLRVFDAEGQSGAGFLARFFEAGTMTPVLTYADPNLTIPHPSPLVADSTGRFPQVFAEPGGVKVIVTDAGGVPQYTLDPVPRTSSAERGPVGFDGFWLDDVPALLADETLSYIPGPGKTVVAPGDYVRTRKEGFAYQVALAVVTNNHIANAGGVKLYVLRGADGWRSVLAFGASADGVTDASAEIQTALRAGGKVTFSGGSFRMGTAVTVNGVDDLVVDASGASFNEVGAALLSHFRFDNCDRLRWNNGHFEAEENQAYFVANTPLEVRAFIQVHTSIDPVITGVSGKNKRRLLHVDGCTAPSVSQYRHEGWMQAVSAGFEAQANNAPAVTIRGGFGGAASEGYVKNHGAALLFQNTSRQVTAWGIRGRDLHDNGVYGSSCEDVSVTGCVFEEIAGDGVKLRGSNTVAAGNAVRGARNRGVVSTALAAGTPDALGAVSASLLVANNVVDGCGRGVEASSVSAGVAPRSAIVSGNIVRNSTATGDVGGGVQVTTNASEVIVSGNLVSDIAADNGIFISSTGGGETLDRVVASGNMVARVNGSGAATRGGLKISRAANVTANGNHFHAIASGIGVRFLEVAGALAEGNTYEGGQVVRAPNGESNSGIIAVNNRGATLALGDTARATVARNFVGDASSGTVLFGSATWNPGSIPVGGSETLALTLTGAAIGNYVGASFSQNISGMTISGYVSGTDTVVVTLANNTAVARDLAEGTVRVRVERH